MPRKNPLAPVVNVAINPGLKTALDTIARCQRRPTSDLVREALASWVRDWSIAVHTECLMYGMPEHDDASIRAKIESEYREMLEDAAAERVVW